MGCFSSKTKSSVTLPVVEESLICADKPWHDDQLAAPKFVCVTVDDESSIRASLDTKLNEHPLVETLHSFDDGKDLVPFIKDNVFRGWSVENKTRPPPVRCVVFLDIMLMTKNGNVRCRELRKEFGDALCIIAATANVGNHSLTIYHNNGFDGVLSKVFTTKSLDILLNHVNTTPHRWFVQV